MDVTVPGGTYHLGSGTNAITVLGNGTVTAGNGNNDINIQGNGLIKVGSGNDTLDMWGSGKIVQDGKHGNDTIYLGNGSDTIKEAGTAVFHTSTGCATVIGGTFEFSNLPGSSFATYDALSGQQTLQGVNGPTEFIGGTGKTLMEGGLGNDTFLGGSGHDTMVGGTANNLFAFLKADAGGNHVITNFVSGTDQLYVEGHTLQWLEDHHDIKTVQVTDSSGQTVTNTVISLDAGATKITLQGVSSLNGSDITTHKPGH